MSVYSGTWESDREAYLSDIVQYNKSVLPKEYWEMKEYKAFYEDKKNIALLTEMAKMRIQEMRSYKTMKDLIKGDIPEMKRNEGLVNQEMNKKEYWNQFENCLKLGKRSDAARKCYYKLSHKEKNNKSAFPVTLDKCNLETKRVFFECFQCTVMANVDQIFVKETVRLAETKKYDEKLKLLEAGEMPNCLKHLFEFS